MRSFIESYLSDIDNMVLFENITTINQNKKVKIEEWVDQINFLNWLGQM